MAFFARLSGTLTAALAVFVALPAAAADNADVPVQPAPVKARWETTFYGVIKADTVYDTTQSFTDLAGVAPVERPAGHPQPPPGEQSNFRGGHGRTQMSLRDSRFGLKLKAPEVGGVVPSALMEFDFFGTLPSTVTENNVFAAPLPRVRHAYVKLETPVVDILIGQTWHVFGWQGTYFPASVQAQGLPGELYARTPQVRLSKTLGGKSFQVESALAVMRPPQRDSGMPEIEGGLRFAFPFWTGVTTAGLTATSIQPASVAVTGDVRDIVVPEFAALPVDTVEKTMSSLAVDAFLPLIPGTEEDKGNSLSVTGELVYGRGTSDLYTSFTGGMQFPTIGNATGQNPAPTYAQNVDNGIVVFDLDGNLHAVQWTTYNVGVQYYLPGLEGRMWLLANYGHMKSENAHFYTRPYASTRPDPQAAFYVAATQVLDSVDFVDVGIAGEPIAGLRVGFEAAGYLDTYVDGVRAINYRGQLGTAYLF